MMDALRAFWVAQTLPQTLVIIFITCGIGLFLGKLKLGRFSLAGAGVFFFGIFMAHFGVQVDPVMMQFCQSFGLVVFVYALGIQVGPSFVASLRKTGLVLNAWGMGLALLGLFFAILMALAGLDSISNLMGVLSGAVTNTPALAAAQQGVEQLHGNSANLQSELNDMALATAITYPFGVVGVIVVLELLKVFFPKKSKAKEPDLNASRHHVGDFVIENRGIVGKSLRDIQEHFHVDFLISRLRRGEEIFQPNADTVLELNDRMSVVYNEDDRSALTTLFGSQHEEVHRDDHWENGSSKLVQRRLLVTKSEYNGATLASLRLRNEYRVNVTRVNRAEIDLVPGPKLRLQLGDRLTVVGEEEGINRLAEDLGNQLKPLDTPYMISIFVGMALGVLVGMLPIAVPGLDGPIMLGLAGGPIIVGILMGAYGARLHVTTYVTQSANLMMRTFGITLFLACLGLASGAEFVATLTQGSGLMWLGLGAFLTIVPTLIVGIAAMRYSSLSYGTISGLICGVMGNPIALDYINDQMEEDTATIGYVSVYPLGIFARVVLAQVTITILLS
ncbi:MAG: putative transporter [Bacteroidales bacterium]|uniref:putative transporter n=1 Tax=Porphyromonas sp. TaxID=1924944 RepID=UPI0029712679|nr:putative transporter [Porphyromonas sp.]MDD7437529.1 putative transporter [Bacteroidales bacterium]MDY3067109.1 putative transporter [Porphyromonas sp.]